MICQECEEAASKLYMDPRTPPLDEVPCLCGDCYLDTAHELINDYQQKISHLETEIMFVQRGNK